MRLENKENVLKDKSYKFAIRVVNVYKHLIETHREYVLSKQLLRSGTSIGANVAEANDGQSIPDFISKMSIALKETAEVIFWLELLRDTDYLTKSQAESLLKDCSELRAIVVASIKTNKKKVTRK